MGPIVRADVNNYISEVSFGFFWDWEQRCLLWWWNLWSLSYFLWNWPKRANIFHIDHALRLFLSPCWEQWGLRSLQITLIFKSLKKTPLKLKLLAIWLFNYLYSNSCIICKHSNLIKIKDTEFTSQISQSNDHWNGS